MEQQTTVLKFHQFRKFMKKFIIILVLLLMTIQLAYATHMDNAGGASWGSITGTLSSQTDLQTALDGKSATSHNHSGSYEPADADLTDLADGSLSASKVAGVADTDYGDITVSSGVWDIEEGLLGMGGSDTVFPADPNADRYLMWDDDPGALVWQTVAGGGDMLKATYDADNDGKVDAIEETILIGANEVYAVGWNADTGLPEKDDIYDYLHLIDTNDDGDVDTIDATLWATKQGSDTDLDDLADGSLSASKVAGVADADYGDVTVSIGAWAVENDSHTHGSGTITEADPTALLTAGTDNIKDTHIDWGTGASQVNPADFVNQDVGDITITTGSWAVEDDSHSHTSTTLPANSSSAAGIVSSGAGQNAQVWKTDASGNPDWRTDATGSGEAFPVGSVFIAVVSTNPATLLGYGTWSAIGAGRVLIGLNSGDTDFDTVEETGGAKTVTSTGIVSQPTFTGNSSTVIVNHTHPLTNLRGATTGSQTTAYGGIVAGNDTSSTPTPYVIPNPTGGAANYTPTGTVSQPTFAGNATSVVQPYLVVYMWKRTL